MRTNLAAPFHKSGLLSSHCSSLVPSGFVRNAEFSTTNQARENRIYNLTIASNNVSVAPPYQSLTVTGSPTPE